MMRIKSIGIKQTAKFFAVFYFFISLVFVLPITLISLIVGFSDGETGVSFEELGGIFILLLPLFYALIGFVIVAIASYVYNLLAKRFGGIEIEFDSKVNTN